MTVNAAESMLRTIDALKRTAQGAPEATGTGTPDVDFKDVLKNAIHSVNQAQNSAEAKAQAFSSGQPGVTIEEVMTSLQTANIAFQGMIAVRNRLVEAYRDITNMQV